MRFTCHVMVFYWARELNIISNFVVVVYSTYKIAYNVEKENFFKSKEYTQGKYYLRRRKIKKYQYFETSYVYIYIFILREVLKIIQFPPNTNGSRLKLGTDDKGKIEIQN